MTTQENLNLLAELDQKDALLRRRTVWIAWMSVAAAAVVLALLVFGAYRELANLQKLREGENREIDGLLKQKSELEQERTDLNKEISALKPLVENYKAIASQMSKAAESQTPAAPTPATASQPRVYLQIVQPTDRDYARQMGKKLTEQGFKVMGIEYVKGAAGLRNTEVRYYKKAEAAEAGKIIETLRNAGDPSVTGLYLGLENSTKVRPRHYEVWFRALPAAAQ